MNTYESFGQCLQRILAERGISASEAARLVNFRSRNSIFRILADDTSCEVDARFLTKLRQAVGNDWPEEHWEALNEALEIKRVGFEQHISNKVFLRTLHGPEEEADFLAVRAGVERPLNEFLDELLKEGTFEIIVTGGCEAALSRLLAKSCEKAGNEGRLSIRHYIDADERTVVRNFIGVLPLVSKLWYNARLVDQNTCPAEMLALYRVCTIIIRSLSGKGERHQLTRYDGRHFLWRSERGTDEPMVELLDRWRYHLQILKPALKNTDAAMAFLDYTGSLAGLENACTILSVKPDIHFNCVPSDVLRPAITEGLMAAGIADGPALQELMVSLEEIHEERFRNMITKRSASHLVYSLRAMERLVRTGVQTDHFYIQRPYTPDERRILLTQMRDTMLSNPYFNVHFLREDAPDLCNEITLYKGKGVLLLDAYSNYALNVDHSEALITQQAFMDRFYRFFMEELLQKYVMSRAETLTALERMIRQC